MHFELFVPVVTAFVVKTFGLGMIRDGNLNTDHLKSFDVKVVCYYLERMNPFVYRLYLAEVQDGLFARIGPVANRSIGCSAFVQIDDVSPNTIVLCNLSFLYRIGSPSKVNGISRLYNRLSLLNAGKWCMETSIVVVGSVGGYIVCLCCCLLNGQKD